MDATSPLEEVRRDAPDWLGATRLTQSFATTSPRHYGMPKQKFTYIKCADHGKQVAAVVCCHMIDAVEPVVFIENSTDPKDLQAWCKKCEQLFLSEGDMTEEFLAYNDSVVICRDCYWIYKKHHSHKRITRN
jgi:hypothetical protein